MATGPYYLIYLIFFLVPGFITLRAFHLSHISLDNYSRLDKLAIVVIGGFISLNIVAILYRINIFSFFHSLAFDFVYLIFSTLSNSLFASPRILSHSFNEPVTQEVIEDLSVLSSSFIILSQSAIGAAIGYWYGLFKRELDSDNNQSREELAQPWERTYAISNIGDPVTVITTQNREIKGNIQQMGSPSKDNDLMLENPEEIIRNLSGEIVRTRPIGDFSYHHYRDVARVELTPRNEYDPEGDTEGIRSFDEQARNWFEALKEISPLTSEAERGNSANEPTNLSIESDENEKE